MGHHAIYVVMAPPPAPAEIAGASPGPEYVWAGGHYEWNGVEYVWLSGRWEPRPTTHAVFVPGRWRHTVRGWTFVGGYWSRQT